MSVGNPRITDTSKLRDSFVAGRRGPHTMHACEVVVRPRRSFLTALTGGLGGRLRQEHAWLPDRHGPPEPPVAHGLRRHHPRRLLPPTRQARHRLRIPGEAPPLPPHPLLLVGRGAFSRSFPATPPPCCQERQSGDRGAVRARALIRRVQAGAEILAVWVCVWQAYGEYQYQRIEEDERSEIIRNACPGPGACGGMYTANTMATAAEALGMTLPVSHRHRLFNGLDEEDRKSITFCLMMFMDTVNTMATAAEALGMTLPVSDRHRLFRDGSEG
jgi:hypothetical protein